MPTLILFTHSFPYGFVEPFLETEIVHLAKHFEHIILVPCRVYGKPRPIPANVQVETSLGSYWPKGVMRGIDSVIACICSPLFYSELTSQWKKLLHWKAMARLIGFIGDYKRVRKWVFSFLKTKSDENIILYTYWLGPLTMAAGSIRSHYTNIKIISRAHRIDLYEDIHPRDYLPFREQTLAATDRVFVVSDHGQHYLAQRYVNTQIEVARLGVYDPGFTVQSSSDGVFRIVSCSYMIKVKRIDLLLEAIATLANENPSIYIEWHHLGGGSLQNYLEMRAKQRLPANVHHFFHGQIPNREVIEFYRTHPIDVFVNVSSSEGIPVSIMEAQSCGLPIIATSVGGTPEIVNNENGILLESNPSVSMVTEALKCLVRSEDKRRLKGKNSKQTWQLMYNAVDNYDVFAERLWTLFKTQ